MKKVLTEKDHEETLLPSKTMNEKIARINLDIQSKDYGLRERSVRHCMSNSISEFINATSLKTDARHQSS